MPTAGTSFTVHDPRYEEKVRESFARQHLMTTLGAQIVRVAPGEVDVEFAHDGRLVQQNGFVHAGAIASIADSANGYAALTLAPTGTDVLAVEFDGLTHHVAVAIGGRRDHPSRRQQRADDVLAGGVFGRLELVAARDWVCRH